MAQLNDFRRKKPKKAPKRVDKALIVSPSALTAEQLKKYKRLSQKMEEWMADDSGEQEKSWAILEKLLKENPLSLGN